MTYIVLIKVFKFKSIYRIITVIHTRMSWHAYWFDNKINGINSKCIIILLSVMRNVAGTREHICGWTQWCFAKTLNHILTLRLWVPNENNILRCDIMVDVYIFYAATATRICLSRQCLQSEFAAVVYVIILLYINIYVSSTVFL